MKKRMGLWVLLLVLAAAWGALAEDTGYTINAYHTDCVLHADNSVTVQETIEVTFLEPSHGIYRILPLRFITATNALGQQGTKWYTTQVRDVQVPGEEFTTRTEDGALQIRIGSARTLQTGTKRYTVAYTQCFPPDRLPQSDFVFFSVLGSEWTTAVGQFSFSFTVDKPLDAATRQGLCLYSGPIGTQENARSVVYEVTANGVNGMAQNLRAGDAVTLFCPLPEGYFTSSRIVISPLPGQVCAALCALLGLGLALTALLKPAEKPDRSLRWTPPENITWPEASLVLREQLTEEDLFAYIPAWAQQGLLEIKETEDGKDLLLTRLAPLPADASIGESMVFDALFAGREKVYLNKQANERMARKLAKARSWFVKHFHQEHRQFTGRGALAALTGGLCVSFGAAVALSAAERLGGNAVFGVIAALLLWGVAVAEVFRHAWATSNGAVTAGLVVELAAIAGSALTVYLAARGDLLFSGYILLGLLFITASACLSVSRLVRPTAFQLQAESALLGLRGFMDQPEAGELDRLQREDSGYYYDMMPYAMAMRRTDAWDRKYGYMAYPPPSPVWWYARRPGPFHPRYVSHSLKNHSHAAVNTARAALAKEEAAKAASSHGGSSGGGGGFSGGGGGGGGGGRW